MRVDAVHHLVTASNRVDFATSSCPNSPVPGLGQVATGCRFARAWHPPFFHYMRWQNVLALARSLNNAHKNTILRATAQRIKVATGSSDRAVKIRDADSPQLAATLRSQRSREPSDGIRYISMTSLFIVAGGDRAYILLGTCGHFRSRPHPLVLKFSHHHCSFFTRSPIGMEAL